MPNLILRAISTAVLLMGALATAPARAQEQALDPAAVQIETFYAALTDAMKQGAKLGFAGRYDKLEPVVKEVFDLPTMTQISVGPTWPSISEADQKALIAAFTRMTVSNYAKNFSSYDGEQFVVDPNVQVRRNDKIVQTKLVDSEHSETAFNYRMRQSGGKWKIIDIFLDGYVSEIARRRSDFASTITGEGPAALIKKINDLSDKIMKES